MVKHPQTTKEHTVKIRIIPVAAGLAAAAGLALTGASLANAENATTTSTTPSPGIAYGQAQTGTPPSGKGNTDPSKPLRDDEQLLTGDAAARVTATAKAKEPTATIERVETDSDGVYEAHLVRADGTHITVQVDKNFAVTAVREGGPDGPGGHGPGGDQGGEQGGQQGGQQGGAARESTSTT
jgi:hypothetical protein